MKESKALSKVFSILREVLVNLDSGVIKEINGIKLYANPEGTYFTAELDKNELTFHFRDTHKNFDEIELGEREELLIIDAFEDFYEVLYKEQNAEELRYEKVIDKLFQNFLKRRKITPHKELLAKSKLGSKKYI